MIGAIDLYDLDGLVYASYDGEKSYGIGKWSVMAYDPFPGKGNYTSFSKEQFPLVNYYSGEELNFEIKNIESTDNLVKFDFLIKSKDEDLH